MKTVVFKGVEYEVPDWARYLAVDGRDQKVFAYEVAPENRGDFYGISSGRYEEIGTLDVNVMRIF